MKEITFDKAYRGYPLIACLGVAALALIMLMGIAGAAPFAYIPNQGNDNVSVIDTATDIVTATVPVGNEPKGVAASPDGTKVYVTNEGTYSSPDNTVSVIDTTTNNVTATVNVGHRPQGVAVSPDGKKVYVANYNDGNVSIIDTSTYKVTASVPVGNCPIGVAVTPPDGKKVYVTNHVDNIVTVINTTTNNVKSVPVGNLPYGIAVTPDGKNVYVVNHNPVTFVKGNVSIINTETDNVIATVPVGLYPVGVAVTPDGTKAYVTNEGNYYLSVIDTATNNVTTAYVGALSQGVAVSPDGKKVYATNYGFNTTSVINTTTNTLTATIKVGRYPFAFGSFITPIPRPEAGFTSRYADWTMKKVNFFDRSINSPTSWYWNFGDGNTSNEQNPTHKYENTTEYKVSLTVSNAAGNDTSRYYILTGLSPRAIYKWNYTDPTNMKVNFIDKSIYSPSSWEWSFGDGNTSTEQNPTHTYSKVGKYMVNLNVSNAVGSSKTWDLVSVGFPHAEFTWNYTDTTKMNVKFIDKSTNSPISWNWDFGDGNNSTEQNPMHPYTKVGKYNVSLNVSNAGGSNKATNIVTIGSP